MAFSPLGKLIEISEIIRVDIDNLLIDFKISISELELAFDELMMFYDSYIEECEQLKSVEQDWRMGKVSWTDVNNAAYVRFESGASLGLKILDYSRLLYDVNEKTGGAIFVAF